MTKGSKHSIEGPPAIYSLFLFETKDMIAIHPKSIGLPGQSAQELHRCEVERTGHATNITSHIVKIRHPETVV